jgi:hypothetical protein
LTGAVSTSETNAATSGRPEASRWSSTSHCGQVRPVVADRLDRARAEGHRLRGIGDVLLEGAPPAAGAVEDELEAGGR